MDTKTKPAQNGRKPLNKTQLLETLQGLGGDAFSSLTRDVGTEIPKEIFKQIFGLPEKKISGNLAPGESVNMEVMMSGQHETQKQAQTQLIRERQIHAEEQRLTSKKQQELKMQLSVLIQEVGQLAQTTQGLTKEIQVAAMSAPIEPGVYHVIFFEKLITFIQSFRKKIENASEWIGTYNGRAKKRANSFWGQVGISGAKRLLSTEDTVTRSAG
ncbi:hypothetical protein HY404_03380 [Candidatus Microgenomates bacterium]|nr:hypothetical protein [Candidatus Microgenomates bacterium]